MLYRTRTFITAGVNKYRSPDVLPIIFRVIPAYFFSHIKIISQAWGRKHQITLSSQVTTELWVLIRKLLHVTLPNAQNLEVAHRFVVNLWAPVLVLTRTRHWSLENAGTHQHIPVPILVLSSYMV